MRSIRRTTITVAGLLILCAAVFGWFGVQATLDFLPASKPNVESVGTFSVVRVIDGDTVVIDVDGVHESVRLIGIDAPEMNWETNDPECYAWEARNRADVLLEGKEVSLERDPSQDARDAYGRLLGYVLLPGDSDFGETMLREGYVRELTYDGAYAKQEKYQTAQYAARNYQLGLFADDACAAG